MVEFLICLIIIVLLYYMLKVLLTLENRVEAKIRSEAEQKGIKIKYMREPKRSDGKNPFGSVDIWIGGSSEIFGFRGERVYNRIVVKEGIKGVRYWVKVRTTFFMPSDIKWFKLDK